MEVRSMRWRHKICQNKLLDTNNLMTFCKFSPALLCVFTVFSVARSPVVSFPQPCHHEQGSADRKPSSPARVGGNEASG